MTTSNIRTGTGGWLYEPWRDTFYPAGLPQKRELEYASRKLSAIEIDSTYYRLQKPATFAKWRDETPDGFMFSIKATMFTTNRRVLAESGQSIGWFIDSGIAELGPKLGPIVWQFATTKQFDAVDFEAFLKLLPREAGGVPLRHALDVRHESFKCGEYLALARRYGATTIYTDSDDYPAIGDVTGSFVYLRLMRASAKLANGFKSEVFDQLADCARAWRDGNEPGGVPRVEPVPPPVAPRDVFIYFINGAKEKAPAAAMALRKRLE
ncbi:MAG: DUF72 domain-containing protein [Betaproteobacteria bacterium]